MRSGILLAILLLLSSVVACDPPGGVSRSAGAAPTPGENYRIRRGETLYSIAQRAYGDPLEWLRLQEKNPWAEPENLQPGDILYIPPAPEGGNLFNVDPQNLELEDPPAGAAPRPARTWSPQTPAAPAAGPAEASGGIRNLFRDLQHGLENETIFGTSVRRLGAIVLAGFLAHGFVQGFLLWLIGTIFFVKDITLRKSLRATFHTEVVTLFTLVILGGVGLLMVHIGTTAPGAGQSPDLGRTVEGYLTHPMGIVIACFAVFTLYLLLALRFIPHTLGLKRTQSTTIIFLAVLLPHLLVIYTVGQRMGLLEL